MDWIAPAIKAIYTILHFGAAINGSELCQPCVSAVGGVYTLGGMAISVSFIMRCGESSDHVVPASEERFKNPCDYFYGCNSQIQDTLEHFNGSSLQNEELLMGIQQMLNGTISQKMQMLKDIKITLKTVDDDMIRNFDELKVFMTEKDFIQNIHNQIEMLWRLMQQSIESQTKHSIERFISKYKTNSAMNILEEFIIGLDNPRQNPIALAMEHNILDSRRIMDHYTHLLSQIVFKVLAIEGFYHGVADTFKARCVDHMDVISKEIDAAINAFRNFVTSYKINAERYWPELVLTTVNSNMDGSDLTETADRLQQKLGGIYTRDVFSIYVWNSTDENQGHHYYYSVDPTKFANSSENLQPGYIHSHKYYGPGAWKGVIVLRSVKFHEIPPETNLQVRTSFQTYAVAQHMMFTVLGIQHNKQLNDFSYFNRRDEFFPEGYKTHGFAAYNITPVVRFTSDGSSILTEPYMHLIPVYHGLTWV